jgi:signal transduction histidine kinase/CheY-like chemotaxis protein
MHQLGGPAWTALEVRAGWDLPARATDPSSHVVQFYERADHLREVVAQYVADGLEAGEPVLIIAGERTRRAIGRRPRRDGHELERAPGAGQLTSLDARELLSAFMVGGEPDRARFEAAVGGAIDRAAAGGRRVRAYAELVDILWRDGQPQAALRVEELWNDLLRTRSFSLLCAYAMGRFHREGHARRLEKVCAAHTRVVPAESFTEREGPEARQRQVVLLQQRAQALEDERAHRRELEAALRAALTEQRRSEEALRLSRAARRELERAAQAAAREDERRKDEFLAMLGHELRNPLAPILTGLELMRLRGGVHREQDVIERQVRHLVRLVDDLLDVARFTRGKASLEKEPVELATVLARAIETERPLLSQRSHALTVEVPQEGLLVDADPVRLAQVFTNLLGNAARYTDPGGHVAVTARRDGDEAVVTVRDDGIGIPPELLPRIFEPFLQGERALDRSQGGLGIGLTTARALVELHGGTLTARSGGPGAGSELIVRLPVLPSSVAARPAPNAPSPDPPVERPAFRILLVDDNEDAAELLAEALRRTGHEVLVAHDGPEALAVAPGFRPDAALLDIGLPGMDGYELARELRRLLGPHPPRLLAVSGYGQDADRERSHAAGFELHLVKPVDLDSLVARLEGMALVNGPGHLHS